MFLALAVLHTWPLALAPGTLARNDTADTVLHEWTLAWLAHQIVRDPLHLFDANIFYPDQLAYSDHLFMPGILVAPLILGRCLPGARLQPPAHDGDGRDRLGDESGDPSIEGSLRKL